VSQKVPLTTLKQMSEINLTPLMDLTFILLITFIITFPLIEQGIAVDLPEGAANELTAEMAHTITLDGDGNLYLDDVGTTAKELERTIARLSSEDPGVTIMVRADQKIRYGKVVGVLKILHKAHITKMALVTREEGSG